MNFKKLIFIIAGPSGAGKSSFMNRVLKDFSQLEDTITCTTRKARLNESEKNPYYFISREEFEKKKAEDFFIEWSEVHGNLYGTPKEQIDSAWSKKKAIIMDVDVNGARSFKSKYPQSISIFILPPSIDALRQRIFQRDGNSLQPEDLKTRMENAEKEITLSNEFDYKIINNEFEASYIEFKKIIEESLKAG